MAKNTSARAQGHGVEVHYRFETFADEMAWIEIETRTSDDEDRLVSLSNHGTVEGVLGQEVEQPEDITRNSWKYAAALHAKANGYWFVERPRKFPGLCLCGCGGMTRGGKFLPGHDAKLQGTHDKHADIRAHGLHCYHVGNDEWVVQDSSEGFTETVARVKVLGSSRSRREDFSGRTKSGYRWLHETRFEVVVRFAYRVEVTIDEVVVVTKGPRTAMIEVLQAVASGAWDYNAKWQLESALREIDVAEWRIIETFDSNKHSHIRNLYDLLQRERERIDQAE